MLSDGLDSVGQPEPGLLQSLQAEEVFGQEDVNNACDDRDWTDILPLVNDRANLSPAELNRKRKKLCFQAMAEDCFIPRTTLVENVVQIESRAMNALFERSDDLSKLHHLVHASEGQDEFEKLVTRPGF